MSQRNSRAAGVRSFRPTLESLEERTLLSNVPYLGLLDQVNTAVQQTNQSFTNAKHAVNDSVEVLQSNPHNVDAVMNLMENTAHLAQVASQEVQLIVLFDRAVMVGESPQFNMVTGDMRSSTSILSSDTSSLTNTAYYNSLAESNQALLPGIQNALADAEADLTAALDILFIGGNASLSSLPSGSTVQSIQQAPSSYCSPDSPSCNCTAPM